MDSLRSLRIKRGFTRNAMARLLGIPPKCYLKYEKTPSTMPSNIAVKISSVIGVSVDDIFFG